MPAACCEGENVPSQTMPFAWATRYPAFVPGTWTMVSKICWARLFSPDACVPSAPKAVAAHRALTASARAPVATRRTFLVAVFTDCLLQVRDGSMKSLETDH